MWGLANLFLRQMTDSEQRECASYGVAVGMQETKMLVGIRSGFKLFVTPKL
jgi:hypothetical protein